MRKIADGWLQSKENAKQMICFFLKKIHLAKHRSFNGDENLPPCTSVDFYYTNPLHPEHSGEQVFIQKGKSGPRAAKLGNEGPKGFEIDFAFSQSFF